MDNQHKERSLEKTTVSRHESQGPISQQLTMTMFGKQVIPLEVHFVAQSSAGTDEDDIMPAGLSEQEEAAFFRFARALRPRVVSSKLSRTHQQNRALPRVEPIFKRQVFTEGTLITITMHNVLREDVVAEISGRTLMVGGTARFPVSSDGEAAGIAPAEKAKLGKPRFLYIYKTGVTEMMDLTSVVAGYREGYVDLFLHRMDPSSDTEKDDVQMEDTEHSS